MSLIVTFTSAYSYPSRREYAPLAVGNMARTELVDIAVTAANVSSLSCANNETAVELYSTEDCWIKIGEAPEAEVEGATSRFLKAGVYKEYSVSEGHKVSVIGI